MVILGQNLAQITMAIVDQNVAQITAVLCAKCGSDNCGYFSKHLA